MERRDVLVVQGPVREIDLKCPGKFAGPTEELLVEVVAPSADCLRDEEARRECNRQAKAKERAKKRGLPLPGETGYVRTLEENGQASHRFVHHQSGRFHHAVSPLIFPTTSSREG